MDSALKQRLIGAAVLVVLAVIFLPMVLDGTGSARDEAIQLELPAQPADGMRTEIVPLPPRGSSAPAPVVSAPAEDPVATVDADVPARLDAVSGDVVGGGSPASASPPQPGSRRTAGAAAEGPTPQAAAAPAPALARVPSEPVTAAPARSASAASATVDAALPGGRYFVSFGSFSQIDNATALIAQLQRAGIGAYAEQVTINGAPAQRVRAGPYPDRARAEQVRQQARSARADLDPVIVDADPVSADAHAPHAPDYGGFAVQIGAYADPATATARRDRLLQAGFPAFVDNTRSEQGVLWRVRVGPEPTRAAAERLREALQARLAIDGRVVLHP